MDLFNFLKSKYRNAADSQLSDVEQLDEKSKTSFMIDYLNTPDGQYQNVLVEFPKDNIWKILINGQSMRYYPGGWYIEKGWSSDHKYQKVYTEDFTFWVSPADYKAFIRLLESLKNRYTDEREDRKESYNQLLAKYREGYQVDSIDDDIWCCYFESPNGFPDLKTKKQFELLTVKITHLCKMHGGKLYKTRAKAAKFAILVSPSSKKQDNVDHIREMGYKVTTLENAVKFFGLEKHWDIAASENHYQEFIQGLENSPYISQ